MASLGTSPTAVFRGRFDVPAATRLLWRAGFGPRPGEAEALAARGLDGAVAALTRPVGRARLTGPAPRRDNGRPLDPAGVWGDAHCWWLDRMVRTDQPFVERMTLVWHSWFATAAENGSLALRQNTMMRGLALGNFRELLTSVTCDPAMLVWLNGLWSTKSSPNENYGREMLELFTLGSGRGYDQHDVHENARALTGFICDWPDGGQPSNFRFAPEYHDDGVKTIFGHRGRFGWRDSCRLAVEHPDHPSFMVEKLWGYFIAEPIPAADARALQRTYLASGFETRSVVEAILRHPLLYEGARLVKPAAVFCAGLLRTRGQGLGSDDWGWIGELTGQMLFDPPNVSGWDYASWLDTARWSGRLRAVNQAVDRDLLDPGKPYPAHETPVEAVRNALRYWHDPTLSAATTRALTQYARSVQRSIPAAWAQEEYRASRQNALRQLIPMTPDWQTA